MSPLKAHRRGRRAVLAAGYPSGGRRWETFWAGFRAYFRGDGANPPAEWEEYSRAWRAYRREAWKLGFLAARGKL